MYTINRPAKIKSIYAEVPVTTVAATTGAAMIIDTSGVYHCRVNVPTGPVYATPLSTAPLTSNAIKIASAGYIDLISENGYVALYSTSTGGTRELIIYKD